VLIVTLKTNQLVVITTTQMKTKRPLKAKSKSVLANAQSWERPHILYEPPQPHRVCPDLLGRGVKGRENPGSDRSAASTSYQLYIRRTGLTAENLCFLSTRTLTLFVRTSARPFECANTQPAPVRISFANSKADVLCQFVSDLPFSEDSNVGLAHADQKQTQKPASVKPEPCFAMDKQTNSH
jgi:hypothetical protein